MSEDRKESDIKTAPLKGEEGLHDKERLDSVSTFLHQIKVIFPIIVLKENFRATHRGLFIAESIVQEVLQKYQSWLEEQTSGEVHKSEAKCMKRLFGTASPLGQYLVEGKNCISGYLIPFEMRQPQKLGIPYYLGSLSSKKDYLHVSDPIIQSLQNVQVKMEGSGVSIDIAVGQQKFHISSEIFRSFIELAQASPRMQRDFPQMGEYLALSCKALVKLIRKSRPVTAKVELLVPQAFADSKKYSYRTIGGFVFVSDGRFNVVRIYDLRGKSLYYFIREEFSKCPGKRIGSFEIYGERHRLLGCFQLSNKKYELRPQALIDFYNNLHDSPDKHDHFGKSYTIQDLFRRFSEIFQSAQTIERHKIIKYVDRFHDNRNQFRINGVWIFALTRDDIIDACINKFSEKPR